MLSCMRPQPCVFMAVMCEALRTRKVSARRARPVRMNLREVGGR